MSSLLRIAANRANAAKSTGPRTAAGKARVSQNAVKHGLLSKDVVPLGESREAFEAMLDALRKELRPRTAFERRIVKMIAAAHFRRRRTWQIETDRFTEVMLSQGKTSAETFDSLCEESNFMNCIMRYETRFSREFLRLLLFYDSLRGDPAHPADNRFFPNKAKIGKTRIAM